jgi:hypothetical protein
MSPVMNLGRPIAATRMSADRHSPGEVRRAAVADRDRGVAREQEHRHRLSDDVAAPDDDRPLALRVDAVVVEHHHHPERRAGAHDALAEQEIADVPGMEAVDIEARVDRVEDLALVDVVRQRQLDEDAVDARVRVQLRHEAEELLLGRLRRQVLPQREDADLLAGLLLVAHVDAARGVVADEDGGEARSSPRSGR